MAMIAPALSLIAMLQAAEPAKTVNDIELGPAADFTVAGPATVCLRQLVIRPKEGQSVQLTYSGIHSGELKLNFEDGTFIEVNEGEAFRDQRKRRQRTEWRTKSMEAYRLDERGVDIRYQLEGRSIVNRWDYKPRALASGTAFRGGRRDRHLFSNISFEKIDTVRCDRRFEYGWGVIFGEEALDTQSDEPKVGEEN